MLIYYIISNKSIVVYFGFFVQMTTFNEILFKTTKHTYYDYPRQQICKSNLLRGWKLYTI